MIEAIKSNQYVKVIKLKSDISKLDDLKKIQDEYSKPIKIRKSMREKIDMNEPEFQLIYSWEERTDERLSVNNIQFQIWNAKIEHQRIQMYNKTGTGLLPKEERTGCYYVPTVFYEKDGAVYLCVITRRSEILKAVEELVDNIDITSNQLATNQNMVEWLFWRFMSNKNNLKDDIFIENLFSFEGNIIEGDSSDLVKGMSTQISNLDVTKAVLSLKEPLNSLKLSMDWEDSNLSFSYSIDGIVTVDARQTTLSDSISSKRLTSIPASYQKLVYIVAVVVPSLIEIFSFDVKNFNDNFEDFRKEQAKKLIAKLESVNEL